MKVSCVHGCFLLLSGMLLSGCVHHTRFTVLPPSDSVLTEVATEATKIETLLPAYIDDLLANYEQPEIRRVQDDLKAIHREKDKADLIDDGMKLELDWAALKALDAVLQQEEVI